MKANGPARPARSGKRGAALRSGRPWGAGLPFAKSYREIVELAPIGIFSSTLAGRFLVVNAAFARMLGYDSAREILRMDIPRDIYLDPSDRQRIIEAYESSPGIVRIEAVLKKKDGSPLPVWFDGRVVRDARGRTLGFEGFVHDITETKRSESALRASEERFRALVENSYEVVGLLDRQGRWTYISPSVVRIWGYTSQEMLATERFGARVHPDDVETLRERFRALLETPGGSASMEFRARDRNESWRVLEAVGVNRLEDPSVGAVVVNFRDITERKQAEERLRRSYEEIRALAARMESVREEESSRIARELHDEIGQSLTAIKIQLQTLKRSATAADFTAELDEGIAVAERALESVRSLSLELRPAVLDDLGLPAALRWYLDRQAQRSGFTAELSAHLPNGRLSRELETACFRVVQEAVTNVARHARARRVRVDLAQDGAALLLAVQDDGIGFDVGSAQARARGGQSLGILGMEERVSQLGGSLTVSSSASEGTRICVRLPVATPSPAAGSR